MAIDLPDTIAYELPELPREAAVSWRLDPNRCALLIHDMQRHFIARFAREAEPARTMLGAIANLRERAHAAGIPVYYSAQPADQPAERRALLSDVWGPGMTGDPRAAEIVEELRPAEGDRVLTKWRYSAFEQTDLADRLREAGRDQLLICGVYAHIGIVTTATAAFMRDIQPFVLADACADFSREEHAVALTWVAGCCGRVLSTAEALDELAEQPESAAGFDLLAELGGLLDDDLSDLDRAGDDLDDWGLDSVRAITLVQRARDAGYDITYADLLANRTFDGIAALLAEEDAAS